jgi:transposase
MYIFDRIVAELGRDADPSCCTGGSSEPKLPSRGYNDRRVISGIVHVLKSGCRWCDCPPEYGPAMRALQRHEDDRLDAC